jgi:hypothetical protein
MSYERGPQGIQGVTGATGTNGTPGTTFSYIGTWVAGSYAVNTLTVDSLDNNTYVCIVQTEPPYLADPPSTLPSNWTLFVNGGPTGETGPTGATGTMDASMSWAFDGAGLTGSTVCNLAPPYTWTTGGTGGTYSLIRTMTTTIPAGWVPKSNTLINLFIWNTFVAVNPTTQQYFTYSLNGGAEQPLSKTSSTRPYGNQGQNQFFPITGNLIGIPLASSDVVVIRFYGRLFPGSGTHTMTNPNEQAYGAFTTAY